MYFEQCTASGHVSMAKLHMGDDAIMDIIADRLFRALRAHATEAGVPDFRAEDCDIHTHVEELTQQVHVRMVWNPQPGHIELLGGPQDGSAWELADPDMDHVRVFPPRPKRDHYLERVGQPPEPVIYTRWKINGASRRWVYRYTS
jgi:hypothetical protein